MHCGEGDELFVILPFFLAIGFCAGFAWTVRRRLSRDFPQSPGAILVSCLAVVASLVVALSFVGPFLKEFRPKGDMLAASAVVVGAIAGRWFSLAESGRDKLIFVSASGLLLLAGALEYDIKILDHLTKFGAGSVNLEFSEQGGSSVTGQVGDPGANTGSGAIDPNSAPLPGANRLDFAIEQLQLLGSSILHDEQYARLFAGESPLLEKGDALLPTMAYSTYQFARYACTQISDLADMLNILQNYHRSETSVFLIDPELVSLLRLSYVRNINNLDPNVGLTDVHDGVSHDFHTLFGNVRKNLKQEIEGLDREHQSLTNDDRNRLEPLRAICSDFKEVWKNKQPIPPFQTISSDDAEDHYAYRSYFAITVALAEFAAGNRENAIQLLDTEIKKQIQDESDNEGKPARSGPERRICHDKPDCQKSWLIRLDSMRRRVIILRLETILDYVISLSNNKAIDIVRLMFLIRQAGEFDRLFAGTETIGSSGLHIFQSSLTGDTNASCTQTLTDDKEGKKLLGQMIVARIAAINNAVWIAGADEGLVDAEPNLIDKMDKLARYISSFNPSCVTALGAGLDQQLVSRYMDSAAVYWEAKGNRFGTTAGDSAHLRQVETNPKDTIFALCSARKLYVLSDAALPESKKILSENGNPDELLADYSGAAYARSLRAGRDRTDNALKNFPAGAVETACEK